LGKKTDDEASDLAPMPNGPPIRRVLIVDDEVIICEYLQRTLRRCGFEANFRLTAEAALEELEHIPYSILVADMRMPGMSELELLKLTRKRFPAVSVVIMTAHGSIETAVQAMKLGARDFITKPFQPEEFILVINKVVENRRHLDVLQALHQAFPDDVAVCEHLARSGLLHEPDDAKLEGGLARRAALLDVLRRLHEAYAGYATVRARLARGLLNTLNDAEAEGDLARRDALLDELRALHQAFGDDAAIREQLAAALGDDG
jgi:DNA-binding response OmpR family regulator